MSAVAASPASPSSARSWRRPCKDGTLTRAYAPATPSCTTALTGASPTTKPLKTARLKP
ncbi:hypothetical protein WBG99_06670 [Streptomyces sp. TG1A-60]|uniref:hypothetical protein n=1 Tax=Streptomyces sp. TG1A-60 TaxID=3129111 RepID=UPI0030D5E42A